MITHPELLTDLKRFFPSVCVIQNHTTVKDSYCEDVQNWHDLHADVPCAVAPAGGDEVQRADMTYVKTSHTVLLAGHYSDVEETMRVLVDGLALDIRLVEHDSHATVTRLACEVVS